jgi:hypothetical protein
MFMKKILALTVIAFVFATATMAGPAEAMFLPLAPASNAQPASFDRAADIAKIQSALESKVVQQRLQDYGLSRDEALTRMNRLSDTQIHQLASHTDAIQAGGDGVDLVVGAIIVALLVVLLIWLVQGKIVIR